MGNSFSTSIARIFIILSAIAFLNACERTLVFGDRAGFNLSISSDVAKGTPLEVNAGLKRSIGGIIPASRPPVNGKTQGEATNMISRFQFEQDEKTAGPFDNVIVISSGFASGKAALAITERPNAAHIVEHLLKPEKLVASSNPEDVVVYTDLVDFVSQSDTDALLYLKLAEQLNLTLVSMAEPQFKAANAIMDPRNTKGNKEILKRLKAVNLIE